MMEGKLGPIYKADSCLEGLVEERGKILMSIKLIHVKRRRGGHSILKPFPVSINISKDETGHSESLHRCCVRPRWDVYNTVKGRERRVQG